MAAIAVAGVGLLCCVSSSVAAAVYNKGDEEDPVVPKTGAGPSAGPIAGPIAGPSAGPIADYTFTNAEIVGQFGPTLPELTKVYTSKMKEVTSMSKQGFQVWTVPQDGTYHIHAYGAKGGANSYNNNPPGKGAQVSGDFTLKKGTKLIIIVGQQANSFSGSSHSHGTGGGGATWVLKDNFTTSTNDIYMVAGGGAGAPVFNHPSSGDANGSTQANVNDTSGGAASIDTQRNAGGGAGWGGNGLGTRATVPSHKDKTTEGPTGGKSPINGATGGNWTYYWSSELSGGFGGGGGASIQIPGGGGGFSGGDAGGNTSNSPPAQGGTSWIMTSAKNRQFLGNHDDNNGKVEITIKSST